MSDVSLRNLTKVYPAAGKNPAFQAVRGIDLEITSGEFMVLVGPSGCGKSTTLRMIAGLESVSDGSIAIGDRVVNQVEPKDRDIAMVFQSYALYPHMSVYDNMAFGLKLRKMPRSEIDQRVREAASLLGLEDQLDRKPKALSGGQRQRVAVGRAIVRQPQVFLFDEPLSNLDAKMRVAMRTEIARLHQRLGTTMIYVTHDQVEAMTMGDRICVMNAGRIMQVGPPLDVYASPANLFVASFIGSPAINLFAGHMWFGSDGPSFVPEAQHTGLRFPLPRETLSRDNNQADRPVTLGIRPEHIDLADEGAPSHGTAQVELVESLGAESYLHLSSAGVKFVARISGIHPPPIGESVPIHFDLKQAHLFDRESGDRL